MTLQTFGRIFNLLPQLAVQDTPAAAPTESADLLQQVRDVLTADLSREMLLRVLTHWLPAIAAAAAVFLFGRILVRLAVSMIEQASRRARMDETLAKFVGNFASTKAIQGPSRCTACVSVGAMSY